jgi:hypothetical protein
MGVATQEQVDALFNIGGRRLTDKEYIGAIDETMNKSLLGLLNRMGIELVEKLEELAPVGESGKLQSTIKVIGVKEYKGGYRLEIGFGADYADYIDKGVKGIQNRRKTYKNAEGRHYQFKTYGMPPSALAGLSKWARGKNIETEATNKIKGERTGKFIRPEGSSLAYYIKKYGIEGRNYKQRSLDAVLPEYKVVLDKIGLNSLILKITK